MEDIQNGETTFAAWLELKHSWLHILQCKMLR